MVTVAQSYHSRGVPPIAVIQGYVPLSLRGAVLYFINQLPRNGYRMGRGDSEFGEAESQMQGRGYRGAWKVANLSVPCPNVVAVMVGVSPVSS